MRVCACANRNSQNCLHHHHAKTEFLNNLLPSSQLRSFRMNIINFSTHTSCRLIHVPKFWSILFLTMKRQRNVDGGTSTRQAAATIQPEDTTAMRKKSKRAVEKVEEEAKNGIESALVVVENGVAWEEWPCLKGVVDEQMSWGYYSLPNWGLEFMAEAYGALFSDVVWDDDIWNLKSIKAIPNT